MSPAGGGNSEETSPLDQLIDLFVYAPVGLLYEYEDVLPQLVKRGKSQVQLAKVLGQMAAKKGQAEAGDSLGDVVGGLSTLLAQSITEFGTLVGLAPTPDAPAPAKDPGPLKAVAPVGEDDDKTAPRRKAAPKKAAPKKAAPKKAAAKKAVPKKAVASGRVVEMPLPITSYDELKAKDIVGMLADLTPEERERIRVHEVANRGRRTILGKLDRLDESRGGSGRAES